jgi:hypothetical protein
MFPVRRQRAVLANLNLVFGYQVFVLLQSFVAVKQLRPGATLQT